MKLTLVVLSLTLLQATLSLAGGDDKYIASEIVEGFQLTLELPTKQLRLGEPIKATVVLRNTADDARDLGSTTLTADDFEWMISGPDRQQLERLKFSQQSMSSRGLRLAGHGEQRIDVELSRLFDFSQTGEYVVTATRSVPVKGTEKFQEDSKIPGLKWLTDYERTTVRSESHVIRITGSPSKTGEVTRPLIPVSPNAESVLPTSPTPKRFTQTTRSASNSAETPAQATPTASPRNINKLVGGGITLALLAFIAVILWRATRRKPSS